MKTEIFDPKQVPFSKMPGHWLLATMGKKVLRPGGLELSTWMIQNLKISKESHVVEFAPGLGRTAKITLENKPKSYTGIEQNEVAAKTARESINNPLCTIKIGDASETGLESESADILYGEAFITMQIQKKKEQILKEISRVLKPGGYYGLHELCLDTHSQEKYDQAQKDLSRSIRVSAKPLRTEEWRSLIESAGFEIIELKTVPMALLELKRLIDDEGLSGFSKIAFNLLRHPTALARTLNMRSNFKKYEKELSAIGIIARKKATH